MYSAELAPKSTPDAADFNRLYRLYAPVIAAELRRFRLPVQVSEDIGQDVAMILWANVGKVADFRSMTAWTRVVTRRQAINKLRTLRREIPTDDEILEVLSEQPAVSDEDPKEALAAHRESLVQEQLTDDAANARGRAAALYYNEQQPVATIAISLDIPVNTVLSHLRRFRLLVQKRGAATIC